MLSEYFKLVMLYKIGKLHFRLLARMVFTQRQRMENLIKSATRAARLYFLIQPMKSLICGVVVVVAVAGVISETPYW